MKMPMQRENEVNDHGISCRIGVWDDIALRRSDMFKRVEHGTLPSQC